MNWEDDDEPMFEIVDESRESTANQDNPVFELLEDEELDADEVAAIGLDPTGRDGNERFPYTRRKLTDAERKALSDYREGL